LLDFQLKRRFTYRVSMTQRTGWLGERWVLWEDKMSAIDQSLERLASGQEGGTSLAVDFLWGRNVLFGTLLILGPIALYFPLWVVANHLSSEASVASLNHFYRALIIVSESWGLVKLLSSRCDKTI